MKAFPLLALVAFFLAGCAAPTFPVIGSPPDLILATPQERIIEGRNPVQFPAGRYVASYRTKEGTVYLTTAAIHIHGRILNTGGLLIRDDGTHALQAGQGVLVTWLLDRPLEIAR